MATLREVHLRIQELSKEEEDIPIAKIAQGLDHSPEVVACHVHALKYLQFIKFSDREKKYVTLTESGRLAS